MKYIKSQMFDDLLTYKRCNPWSSWDIMYTPETVDHSSIKAGSKPVPVYISQLK